MVPEGIFEMVAKTQAGFEEVLAAEIDALGGTDIIMIKRAVTFKGDKELLYKCHLWLRSALRILIPIHFSRAKTSDDLYKRAMRVRWSDHLRVEDTFAIDSVANSEFHTHSFYAGLRVKDAICDQFRDIYGERPSVDLENPSLRINLHIYQDEISFALDASGESLHRRGYRLEANEAPLNEAMAAGMLLLTGWDGQSNFGDIMCGSGTILIEAAQIAMDIAPGLGQRRFGFQNWKDFDRALWHRLVMEAEGRKHPPKGIIFGSDISSDSLDIAQRNIERAGLSEYIKLNCKNFADARPPEGPCLLVLNPPYGERLDDPDLDAFYKLLGDTFKQHFQGSEAWVLSGNLSALKRLGLRPSKRIPLWNGAIDCRFNQYELYGGTREQSR